MAPWAVLLNMERNAAAEIELYEEEEQTTRRSAFWHMQAVFDKLRLQPDSDAPVVVASVETRPHQAARPASSAILAKPRDEQRPAWLGPEPGQGGVTVTRCAWAVSPLERAVGGASDADCYGVLGIVANAGVEQLRQRFRQLVKQHHPDRGGDEGAFRDLASAYREALRRRSER